MPTVIDRLKALEAAATKGEWYVSLNGRHQRSGVRYGCDLWTCIPTSDRQAWQGAGSVPLAQIGSPSNPHSIHDPIVLVESERNGNARFIATARNTYAALLAVAEAAQAQHRTCHRGICDVCAALNDLTATPPPAAVAESPRAV